MVDDAGERFGVDARAHLGALTDSVTPGRRKRSTRGGFRLKSATLSSPRWGERLVDGVLLVGEGLYMLGKAFQSLDGLADSAAGCRESEPSATICWL